MDKFSGFSRELAYARCRLSQAIGVLSGSALAVGLPAAINAYTLQPAIPSAGGGVTPSSPLPSACQRRNLKRLLHRGRLSACP